MLKTKKAGLGRSFWLLWTAASVSSIGDGVRYIAFPLLAADLTTDPQSVSLVFAAGYLPWPLFGMIGGAIVDRVDRRKLMWRTDLLRAIGLALFAALLSAQTMTITILAALSFALGVAEIFFVNASATMIPNVVDHNQIGRANSWLISSTMVSSVLIGTVVGSVMFSWNDSAPFIADAATFLVASALGAVIRGNFTPRREGPRPRVSQDVTEGLRWLVQHRLLRTCCLLLLAIEGALTAAESILVLYANDVLHLDGLGYSLLIGVMAAGGLAGSFLAPVMRARLSLSLLLLGCLQLQAVAMVFGGLIPTIPVAVASLTVIGLTSTIWGVTLVSLRQELVPNHLLGRVTSSFALLGRAAAPVGAVVAGAAAQAYGLRLVFVACGLFLAFAGAIAWATAALNMPIGRHRKPIGRHRKPIGRHRRDDTRRLWTIT